MKARKDKKTHTKMLSEREREREREKERESHTHTHKEREPRQLMWMQEKM